MIYVVTHDQATDKDMGVLRGKSTGGYRTRSKQHMSNIENKNKTTEAKHVQQHHQPQTQPTEAQRGR